MSKWDETNEGKRWMQTRKQLFSCLCNLQLATSPGKTACDRCVKRSFSVSHCKLQQQNRQPLRWLQTRRIHAQRRVIFILILFTPALCFAPCICFSNDVASTSTDATLIAVAFLSTSMCSWRLFRLCSHLHSRCLFVCLLILFSSLFMAYVNSGRFVLTASLTATNYEFTYFVKARLFWRIMCLAFTYTSF